MNDKHLGQYGGPNSENYQSAGPITVNQSGLTFTEAKEVVMLLMEQNFIKFSEQALVTAKARVEEMTTAYLDGLAAKDPTLVEQVQDPGVQMALVSAQKEYVKTGDEDLANLLVSMLVERTSQKQRTMLQISLDESITIAGKLTNNQLSILTLNFFLLHVGKGGINSLESLQKVCDTYVKPLIDSIQPTYSDVPHIIACNCGLLVPNRQSFIQKWQKRYVGLFSKGFTIEQAEERLGMTYSMASMAYPGAFIKCINDETKFQIACLNDEAFTHLATNFTLSEDKFNKMKALLHTNPMATHEIEALLSKFGDYMTKLFKIWDEGSLSLLLLNTIGQSIAIAVHGNVFEKIDYSIWIDD